MLGHTWAPEKDQENTGLQNGAMETPISLLVHDENYSRFYLTMQVLYKEMPLLHYCEKYSLKQGISYLHKNVLYKMISCKT